MNLRGEIEGLWEATFTNSLIGIAIASVQGNLLMANPALCMIVNQNEKDLTNSHWLDLLVNKLDHVMLVYSIQSGESDGYQLNSKIYRKQKSPISARIAVSAIRNQDRKLCFLQLQFVVDGNAVVSPALKKEIEQAIAHREFIFHYQDFKDLQTLETVGYEALIRWQHPTKGLLYPVDFIAACEGIPDVCSYVLMEGLSILPKINGWLSINIAPQSLSDQSFINTLQEFSKIGDRPRLYIEITERYPLDFESLKLVELLGYGVFVDDFGQGYSGLIQVISILKKIQNERVKIKFDIWFTQNLHDRDVYYLAGKAIAIVHEYGLKVIAEGIETKEQFELWRSLGCDYGQGWLWGKAKAL